jgi:hypothetical protein
MQKFNSRMALGNIRKIVAAAKLSPITYLDAMRVTKLGRSTAREYLQYLRDEGRLYLTGHDGLTQTYRASGAPSEDELDDLSSDVIRRTSNPHALPGWIPHPDPIATAWMTGIRTS